MQLQVDPAQFTTKRLARDLAALLTALGVARAVVVGHDWGSFTAGRVALWHPDRVLALVLSVYLFPFFWFVDTHTYRMSVPYTPPALAPTTLANVAARAPNLGYQLFFASPEAVLVLEANVRLLPYLFPIAKLTSTSRSLTSSP